MDNYADKSFWEDNKTFTFATVYEKREYQVFAAIKTKILQAGETPRSFLFSAYRNKINNVEEDGTLNILKYNIQTEARKYFNK